MKCPMCGGDGITDKFTPNVGRCIKCNGSGEIEPTNEEWLHSLNTEQLAEWIASVVQKAISIKESNGIVMLESAIWWDEWLKQPHTIKE